MNTVGLSSDKSKKEVKSKYNTFCSLCRKRITQGEVCYSWDKKEFMVHLDCNAPEVKSRMSNTEFRKNAKNGVERKKRGSGRTSPHTSPRSSGRSV